MESKIEKILTLIQEHPTLPIIPMVWGEVIGDDEYRRWAGSWGDAYVAKYFMGQQGIYFYDEEDREDCMNDPKTELFLPEQEIKTNEQELEAYRALPWSEAIIVDIDMPNEI